MNPRYREAFRRHRVLYSLPMVIVTLLALWYVAGAPKAYESGASLWVDTPAPEASSLTQTNQFVMTPATQAQQLLEELLTTRDFRLEVGRRGPLAKYLAAHPTSGFGPSALLAKLRGHQSLDDLVVAALGPKQVLTTIAGPQVLGISLKGPTPVVAVGTLRALITSFERQRNGFDIERERATVAYFRSQASAAGQTLIKTQSDIASFQAANPGITGAGQTPADAQLHALLLAERVAKSRYTAANKAANQAQLDLLATTSSGASFHVVDPPVMPTGPASGKKKQLMAIVGGLFAGGLLSFLTIVLFGGHADPDPDPDRLVEGPPRPSHKHEALTLAGGVSTASPAPVGEAGSASAKSSG